MYVTPDPFFKSFGVVSIALTWIGLLLLLYKWKGDKSLSFSHHAAQTKAGQIYYFVLFAITLPLFFLFIWRWYVPTLKLPDVFIGIVIVGILGQLLAVLVPALGGTKERIHNFGAYSMAVSLIPASIFIALGSIPSVVEIFALISVAYLTASVVLFFMFPRLSAHYLYFQSAYILTFHALILTSTYIT